MNLGLNDFPELVLTHASGGNLSADCGESKPSHPEEKRLVPSTLRKFGMRVMETGFVQHSRPFIRKHMTMEIIEITLENFV